MPRAMARTEKIDLRLTPRAKKTLQSAAAASRKSVTDFVLDSALERAEELLPDRRRFGLNAEQWRAFCDALDAPMPPAPRLSRLLNEPSVFEKGHL